MDQERAVFNHDAALGVIPPDFIIDKTLEQMGALLATPPEKATIVTALVRKTAAARLPGLWQARVMSAYKMLVLPALQRQADALRAAKAQAVHTAGVARLPKGPRVLQARIENVHDGIDVAGRHTQDRAGSGDQPVRTDRYAAAQAGQGRRHRGRPPRGDWPPTRNTYTTTRTKPK